MKDQIKSNIITKHLAGLCSKEEEQFLTQWLKSDPRHYSFFNAIQFQAQINPLQKVKIAQHA